MCQFNTIKRCYRNKKAVKHTILLLPILIGLYYEDYFPCETWIILPVILYLLSSRELSV